RKGRRRDGLIRIEDAVEEDFGLPRPAADSKRKAVCLLEPQPVQGDDQGKPYFGAWKLAHVDVGVPLRKGGEEVDAPVGGADPRGSVVELKPQRLRHLS